jgi:hypothetical protein
MFGITLKVFSDSCSNLLEIMESSQDVRFYTKKRLLIFSQHQGKTLSINRKEMFVYF